MIYTGWGKRFLDLAGATVLSSLLLPLILIAYLLVRASSPGPGFFYQERVGRRGSTFRLIKLRTMHVNANRTLSQTTSADPDVFAVGAVLRRLKLDELPQLFNVLLGDMSLVGPRPMVYETAESMPEWAKVRMDVRPGLTGLAQVSGNITLSWPERWHLDAEYVREQSILLDLRIMLKTILVVLLGEDRFRRTS